MMSDDYPATGGLGRFYDRFAWVALLVCAIAAWIGLGRLHAFQDSDSLLPVLVSVQRWTPFFWGQDRFGMLVPLLVMPIHHPLANLLVQGWIMTVAALLAPFLVARHLGNPHWFAVGALANALIVLLLSQHLQFDWLVAQPYALSITLATFSMLVAEGAAIPGSLAAAVLMLLAHWVNLGICVLVFPLLIVRGRASIRGLLVTVVGFAGGAAMRTLGVPQTIEGLVAAPDWPHAWFMLARTMSSQIAHPVWLVIVVAAALAGAVRWIRTGSTKAVWSLGAAALVGCLYWLVVGTFRHVQASDYLARYVLPSVVLFAVSIAIGLMALVDQGLKPAVVASIAAAALTIAAVANYSVPSVGRLRRTIDREFGAMTPYVENTGATVIVGDYWTVWPAVFHANLASYGQAGRHVVFGLSYRSDATNPLWWNLVEKQTIVLAGSRLDNAVGPELARLPVRARFVEFTGPVSIFVAGASP
jgi:hypothetical protein